MYQPDRQAVRNVLSLVLLVGLVAGPASAASAAEKVVRVGQQVVEGMAITVELEAPKRMQMPMAGMGGKGQMGGMGQKGAAEWQTFRPKAGALTHHLTVILATDKGVGIPYADVTATIVNRKSREKIEKELPAMFGDRLLYGTNVRLEPGEYELLLKVGPPTLMRVDPAIDRWLRPIQAKFAFQVK